MEIDLKITFKREDLIDLCRAHCATIPTPVAGEWDFSFRYNEIVAEFHKLQILEDTEDAPGPGEFRAVLDSLARVAVIADDGRVIEPEAPAPATGDPVSDNPF